MTLQGSASGLRVRAFAEADAAAWDEFVGLCPESTFFHRIGWRGILEKHFGFATHYLLAERAGAITGILPLAEVKSWLSGHSLVSLPFAVYAGVATSDAESSAALHAAAVELGTRLGVAYVEFRNSDARMPDWPRQPIYVAFRKALLPEVEANMLAIPRKQRAMVRKATERNLSFEIDADPERFASLYQDNQHRHGSPPHSRGYFRRLFETFGGDCEVLTVLSPQGKPVSSVLSFYFKDTVLPFYAGDIPDARDLAANDFKYWSLMCHALGRGMKVFDYGRSKVGAGSYSFKKNWGFEPAPLHYEFKLLSAERIPESNPNNPKYKAMIAMWRKLPRGIVNAVGPRLIRHVG